MSGAKITRVRTGCWTCKKRCVFFYSAIVHLYHHSFYRYKAIVVLTKKTTNKHLDIESATKPNLFASIVLVRIGNAKATTVRLLLRCFSMTQTENWAGSKE